MTSLLSELLSINEADSFEAAIVKWKAALKKKYPAEAAQFKYKSVDGGKRLSAEIPGKDRCYGVLDLETGKADVLGEAAKDAPVNEDAHFSSPGVGNFGAILTIDDTKDNIAEKLAKLLGVDDGWDLTELTQGLFAAYSNGDRLTFFTNSRDFEPDED